ncbi:hypothetical protein IscW_ISCW022881 [Ixodes scapularis]|uniref:Uncharacterized protein n=1 Tax=Ixodes scapularis TaxID=6945 RepID=B7QD54_IXOSC|nr:hypothetical protein IscW_ISCW022881 [Ixodes scapularis]|eukprot:XP_002413468.1 hypothetical protein IscW_ISCW022881 [Ixodes scapularis]
MLISEIPSAERLLELQRQFADKERLLQESQAQVCLKLHEAEDKISQLESGQFSVAFMRRRYISARLLGRGNIEPGIACWALAFSVLPIEN